MTSENPCQTINGNHSKLKLKQLGIDTYQEPVIYMRRDCHVCRSEGFQAQSRVRVQLDSKFIIATLNVVDGDLLGHDEAGLSKSAWERLGAKDGDLISVSHPNPLQSLKYVRSKIYGHRLSESNMKEIIQDVAAGRYADVQLAAFISACAENDLDLDEITALTQAMVNAGERLSWKQKPIMDKHCAGGLPGNRTSMIIVPIVAAFGLTIPKTSSRAITSPAGTADAMETVAPVNLELNQIRRVVDQEGGCIVWGGTANLSPIDDIFIRVERSLDIDSAGQLVASVLSKKLAAGSTHVIIDLPVGPTAKIRTKSAAFSLMHTFENVGSRIGLHVKALITDGAQPVGRGIGPALEAREVLEVLQNSKQASFDLRTRALFFAGQILELSGRVEANQGQKIAEEILTDGRAFKKFVAICEAQGGMREPTVAQYTHDITTPKSGKVTQIDNRLLARVAKLAGAPHAPSAGVFVHVKIGNQLDKGAPLFTIHAETKGELNYALKYFSEQIEIIKIEETK